MSSLKAALDVTYLLVLVQEKAANSLQYTVSHQPAASFHCWARSVGLYSLIHWVASITGPDWVGRPTVIVCPGWACTYSFHHWSWLLGLYSWFPAGGVQCGSCTETQQYQGCKVFRAGTIRFM